MEIPGKDSIFRIDGIEDYPVLEVIQGYWIFSQDPDQQTPVILINNIWYVYAFQEHLVELVSLKNQTTINQLIGASFNIDSQIYYSSGTIQGVFIKDFVAVILIDHHWQILFPVEGFSIQPLSKGYGKGDVFLYNNKNYVVEQVNYPNKLIGKSGQGKMEISYKNSWYPEVKFQEKPVLTGIKEVDKKILLNLDPTSLVNFCQTSPFVKEICNDEKFFQEYLTLNPTPFYIPKHYRRLGPLTKTSNEISWKELFMESYKLSNQLEQWDLKQAANYKDKQNYKITYEETGDFVKSLIRKNHIDVLTPYFTVLSSSSIGQHITYGGAELGNKQILKLIWDNRFRDSGLEYSFKSYFSKTTPEGADYLISLGYRPDNIWKIAAEGNLNLLKHMVNLGYRLTEMEANWALNNNRFETLKYLIEEKNVFPNQEHLNSFIDKRNNILDNEYYQILDYVLRKGYWSTSINGVFQAIEEDRPELLDWIAAQPYNNLTRANEGQYNIFIKAAQGKPGVQAWFERHPYEKR